MLQTECLFDLLPGQKGRIQTIGHLDSMKRRLQDLGFIKGSVVECVGISSFGDPIAYLVKGAVIAIRNEDAKKVMITMQEEIDGTE